MSLTSTFRDVQFPTDISYGSKGGAAFSTSIFESSSGREQRNINWLKVRGEWDVSYGIKTTEQMDAVIQFFYTMQGKAYAFRFKDWADFTLSGQIGTGDGTTTQFQITKTYSTTDEISGQNYTYVRDITKPVPNTIGTVTVNSAVISPSNYGVDNSSGIITFATAPGASQVIAISYLEFDVPARFDTDKLDISQDYFQTESWSDIKIVEVKS